MEEERIDLVQLAKEMKAQFDEVGSHVKEALDPLLEDVQYALDKQIGKALAQHPELYAELRKSWRQARRTLDKAAESFGLK